MRENRNLNAATRAAVSKLLGVPIETEKESLSLVDTADDHAFIWNAR